jgi:murein DD-endopeptidase MepM/ murein hydrolase activator NlpD
MGLSMSSVREITGALKKEKMTLKAGQKITYTLEHQGESVLLQRLFLSTEFGQGMGIERLKDGSYRLKKTSLPLVVTTHCVRGVVRTNFSADAIRSGLPKDIANSVPSAFGSLVDFKRGLCPGDRFEVFFDRVSVKGSKERKSGKLLHASVVTGGAKVAVYRSPTQEGNCFYTDNAESVRRGGSFALPVVGARKTSGFGVRRHPILGRRRLHRGVDFSAPRGTPVLCSADGTVERVVSERGYGRCILVRHRGGYETFYAHLSKVGRGVCPGMHVKGGQAIGSVGSSGSATGSHLHYEVRLCGKPIDPASVRALAPQRLSGKELRKFKEFKRFADSSVRHIST